MDTGGGCAASRHRAGRAAGSQSRSGPTIETALGTRWAVWVGGLALALGGIFLVRYSIEAGIFGPELRLILAGILGVALVAAGEFIRRTGFQMPVEGMANAYVPGILTAAGAFTLFGTVYAAHGIYGFIGPTAAFTLLGADRHRHHRRVADPWPGAGRRRRGRLLVTPVLVASESPNHGRCSAIWRSCWPPRSASRGSAAGSSWPGAGLLGVGLWTVRLHGGTGGRRSAVVAFIRRSRSLAWPSSGRPPSRQTEPSISRRSCPHSSSRSPRRSLDGRSAFRSAGRRVVYGAAFMIAHGRHCGLARGNIGAAVRRRHLHRLVFVRWPLSALQFRIDGRGDDRWTASAAARPAPACSAPASRSARLLRCRRTVAARAVSWQSRAIRAASWAALGVVVPLVVAVRVWVGLRRSRSRSRYAALPSALAACWRWPAKRSLAPKNRP